MTTKRFILNAARSAVQGSLINVGKDSEEYIALTNAMTMAPADMQEIGLAEGQMALIRTEFGEAPFKCESGKIPLGMIFVAYGPPTCKLMGGDTDGTGMPTSKGWEVEVIPL
jgi:formylmethanofuran dehydrogenase subunit D